MFPHFHMPNEDLLQGLNGYNTRRHRHDSCGFHDSAASTVPLVEAASSVARSGVKGPLLPTERVLRGGG